VLREGGSAPAVLNAANEIAVAAFLDNRLPFNRITEVISAVLDRISTAPVTNLSEIMESDRRGREAAREIVSGALVQ
jgi:1-deoxy-D-xylulose-5-phosphate reductoisomerase